MSKFTTYAITLRPLNGVTDNEVEGFVTLCKRLCNSYHVVTEKTGSQRHIHAALFLKKGTSRSNVAVVISRHCKKFGYNETERAVALKGVKIMYNNDWLVNYLDKEDDTEVVGSDLPPLDRLIALYPPKPSESTKPKASLYYVELEKLMDEHWGRPLDGPLTLQDVMDFLFEMMYSKRLINVLRDDKTVKATAKNFLRFYNKQDYSDIALD